MLVGRVCVCARTQTLQLSRSCDEVKSTSMRALSLSVSVRLSQGVCMEFTKETGSIQRVKFFTQSRARLSGIMAFAVTPATGTSDWSSVLQHFHLPTDTAVTHPTAIPAQS